MAAVVIATMHGKEAVLGPLIESELGLDWRLAEGLDTDRFGTFSGEVARAGAQAQAARAKAEAALARHPDARYALASEGSFGPHPQVPFVAAGLELVLLVDRETGHAVSGWDLTPATNYRQATTRTLQDAEAFAAQVRFPSHALIIAHSEDPRAIIAKGVSDPADLRAHVAASLAETGAAFLSTDMRAHLNPTRMTSIAAAGRRLVEAYRSRCPGCATPGFVVQTRQSGLPCGHCGGPTHQVRLAVRACEACGLSETTETPGTADPQWCDVCNP